MYKKPFLLFTCLFFIQVAVAQVKPIIDNGFLGYQFWATGIHPSGEFVAKADRSVIHAYDRRNNMLFQTFQAPCIVNSISFSPDGKLMLINTLGEINEECNRVVIYDFYTGNILYNQKGRIIKTIGKGDLFYIRRYDPDSGMEHLEVHSYANPARMIENRYYPVTDTTATVMMGKDNSFLEIEGKYLPGDITTGKLPADSLPKAWRNAKVKNDPLKYIQFEYRTETADDSLVVTSTDFSLIIDTIGIMKEGEGLALYGMKSGRFIKTIDDVQFFGYSYLSSLNRLYFADGSTSSVSVSFDPATLLVERKQLGSFYGNYRVMTSDSTYYDVDVAHPRIWITYSHGGSFAIVHPFEDLFNDNRYYGEVYADLKLIVHNKNKIIDLDDMTIADVSVFVDTTLLHPGVVTLRPSDPHILKINNWTWDMKSAQQFIPQAAKEKKNPTTADSTFFNTLVPVNKPAAWMGYYLAGHLPLFNYDTISYPFRDEMSHFSNDPVTPANQHYTDAAKSLSYIYTDKEKRQLYLLNVNTGYELDVTAPMIAEKDLKKEEAKFMEFAGRLYSPANLMRLNQFPDYTLFPFTQENKYPLNDISDYTKEKHYPYIYEPVLLNRAFKTTDDRKKAEQYMVRNLFKLSFQPRFPFDQSEYTVNIINREGTPLLDYAGIVPENDLYYSDFTFPLSDQKLLSFNYAYGVFTLKNADGSPIMQSSLYRNGEFIHVTPEGYYYASKNKLKRISLRKGNSVYPIEQFDLKYNRPDIVLQRLGCTDQATLDSYHRAYLKRLKKLGFTEDMLKDDFHLPEVEIKNRQQLPAETDSSSIELNLDMHDSKHSLDRINIWINGVPAYGTAGISLRGKNIQSANQNIRLALCPGINRISVSVLNGAGAESYQSMITVHYKNAEQKPDLYLVTIGDSKYADERFNLSFAAKDAQDIGHAFQQNTAGLYGNVFCHTLTDENVSRENVQLLKEKLMQAKRNDVVIVTVAGHGVLDQDFNYYLATYGMDFNDPAKKGLPYENLEALLDGIAPLKKTLLIDACHSGEVDKEEVEQLAAVNPDATSDVKFRTAGAGIRKKNLGFKTTSELMGEIFTDLRRGTGATVISSASGVEYAMESDAWKNGLFTYCLLNGLKNMHADLNKDGEVWLLELQQYLSKEVADLSQGRQQPTSRIENMSMDFRLW